MLIFNSIFGFNVFLNISVVILKVLEIAKDSTVKAIPKL